MLRSLRDVVGYVVEATDGQVGKIADFLFGDLVWTVHYGVVDTGQWLPGRQVLLAPVEFGELDGEAQRVSVSLTRQQIEGSPPLEADRPVSRQKEVELADHFSWGYYWALPDGPVVVPPPEPIPDAHDSEPVPGDPHLRSVDEVCGYAVVSSDGQEVGRVEDFIAESDSWIVRYLAVSTQRGGTDTPVLISPAWIDAVEWGRQRVTANLAAESIDSSPVYDPSQPVGRDVETRLYDYYGRPRYWES